MARIAETIPFKSKEIQILFYLYWSDILTDNEQSKLFAFIKIASTLFRYIFNWKSCSCAAISIKFNWKYISLYNERVFLNLTISI